MGRIRIIARTGSFYGNVAETVRKYREQFDYKVIPRYGQVAGIEARGEERGVCITFAKFEDIAPNALLIVTSASQDLNIAAADEFEELTGLDLRPAKPEFCENLEHSLNHGEEALRIMLSLRKQRMAPAGNPLHN